MCPPPPPPPIPLMKELPGPLERPTLDIKFDKATKELVEMETNLGTIFAGATDLCLLKHRDYGSKNISEFGEFGVLVRMWDKFARLRNLLGSDEEPNNESIDDTLVDIINYAAILQLVRSGKWPN